MDAARQDGFIKNLMCSETKEAFKELMKVIEDIPHDINRYYGDNIIPLITEYLQSSEITETSLPKNTENNKINGNDIFNIIRLILEHKLDFSNRLGGTRNILEQWQKTRAQKNEEFSIKFRESGNDYLRSGQLNNALHFYNEALQFGWFF